MQQNPVKLRPCSLPTVLSPLQMRPQIFYLGLLFSFYLFVYYLLRYSVVSYVFSIITLLSRVEITLPI